MDSSRHLWRSIGGIVVACGLVGFFAAPSLAQTKFLERVRRHYQLNPATGKCLLCHELKPKEEAGRKNLNAYGKAIQNDPAMKPLLGKDDTHAFNDAELKVVVAAAVKIENEDSDKDGATNKEEMDLDSFPGDAKSVPDPAKLAKLRKAKK